MKITSNPNDVGRKQKGFYQRGLHTAVLPTSFDYEGKYCVYGLASSQMPNVIQYVGYTSQKLNLRYNNHLSSTAKKNPKDKWVKELLEQGHKLHMILLEESIPFFEQACEREQYHIKELGKDNPLKNVTEGGAGTKGMKHSDETRKKQSKAHQNKVFSVEHRSNISASQRKRHKRRKEALKMQGKK